MHSADLQLHDSEFQTEGALMMKALAASETESNNMSDNRSMRAGR